MTPNRARRAKAVTARKINRWGCRPKEDVCLEHCEPLACRHGCSEAREHQCLDKDRQLVAEQMRKALEP